MNYDEIYNKAEAYYAEGNYLKALELFEFLNSLQESNDCLNYIGSCYIALNDLLSAKECFEGLIKKKS